PDGRLTGNKMSKSLGNYIGISEPPLDMYLKTMSVSDELMWRYYELLSAKGMEEIRGMKERCSAGSMNPRDAKSLLGKEIVGRYHGASEAETASAKGDEWLQRRGISEEDIERYEYEPAGRDAAIVKILAEIGVAKSVSEAKRKVLEGAVHVNGERVEDINRILAGNSEHRIRFGKKKLVIVKIL
ncbi:MAG: tyrosine--tRNA ligase, partial [Deltaproteobacteria bacterium]|nr:tyrosine--tRNA ligase [Deltaproteobacteria bacterium]